MKSLSFSLLLLLSSGGGAFALKSPDPAKLQILENEIKQIQALQGSDAGSDPSKWTGIKGLAENIGEESRTIDPDQRKIAAWKTQLESLRARNAILCQALIGEARTAYGIEPHQWSGPIVLTGGFKDTRANWHPKFGEREQERTRLNKDGNLISMRYSGSYAAITWENGDIVVTIDAFLHSPGYLAAIIEHETIHFDQFTTSGRGDRLTPVEREWEAYKSMQGHVADGVFHLTDAEKGFIDSGFKKAINAASASPSGAVIGASEFEPVAPELLRENGDASFLQSLDGLKQLSKDSKEITSKEMDIDRQFKKRSEEEERRLVWERIELVEYAKKYLQTLAAAACSDPSRGAAFGDNNEFVSMAKLLPDAMVGGSYDTRDTSGPGSLNDCQMGVLDSFDSARREARRITSADFARWARTYHETHPGFLKRLAISFSNSLDNFHEASDRLRGFLDDVETSDGGGTYSGNGNNGGRSRSDGNNSAGFQEQFQRSMAAQNEELKKYDPIVHNVYTGNSNPNWDNRKQ